METQTEEALRYAGVHNPPAELIRQTETILQNLKQNMPGRYIWQAFDLEKEAEGIRLKNTSIVLKGKLAAQMLNGCSKAVLLASTLGGGFEQKLRRMQAVDMAEALLTDACGSVLVEEVCDRAEREIQSRFDGQYLSDRFSPGYGDLPLALQKDIAGQLNLPVRLGVYVQESLMMNPSKSVTAVIGIANHPLPARIRGCKYCRMHDACQIRKKGNTCHD